MASISKVYVLTVTTGTDVTAVWSRIMIKIKVYNKKIT